MNEKLKDYLSSEPELYPHQLEERFPRVFVKIVDCWDSPEGARAIFDELLIDQRGGRQGFPSDVAREIFQLSVAHERLRAAPVQKGDVWDVEVSTAKHTLEELGMRPIAADMARAAEKGDASQLLLFLDAGMPVDTRDSRDWTPLMVAAFHGNEAAAKLLIERGADPCARDRAGYTPLHWAALKGYQEVVTLIARKTDCNVRSTSGLTPLIQAAASGHTTVVQLLLGAGANPNTASDEGWTPLHKAVANGHVEVVRALLAAKADVHAEHTDGATPLSLAAKSKNKDMQQLVRAAPTGR